MRLLAPSGALMGLVPRQRGHLIVTLHQASNLPTISRELGKRTSICANSASGDANGASHSSHSQAETSSSSAQPTADVHPDGLEVQELESAEDIKAVAKLRSGERRVKSRTLVRNAHAHDLIHPISLQSCRPTDAYYEDQPTRFLETFKRQFVDAEVRSLLQRTGLDGRSEFFDRFLHSTLL